MSIKKSTIITLLTVLVFCVALTGCRQSPALTRMVEEDASTNTGENAGIAAFVDDTDSEKHTETLGNADNSTETSTLTQPSNSEYANEADNDGHSSASDTKVNES